MDDTCLPMTTQNTEKWTSHAFLIKTVENEIPFKHLDTQHSEYVNFIVPFLVPTLPLLESQYIFDDGFVLNFKLDI